MTSNGGREEELQLVSHVKEEYKEDVNVTAGNKPGSQQSNELQVSKVDGRNPVVVHRNIISLPPQPQQQPQGSLIHWERFLHVESIKVMLVENDDCTRHIVTALLRNCNYEVIEAANGFQAWKILENLSNHIDIVLTEVVMPCLSGIGLLCKIMSHKTRKNIPVIMMSSHDSMGLVFKCLSKGAVDFLVKPIRKNELKNLWQHVWRRCHSSSGSGSESGTQAQKSVNSKNNLRYDNSGSKDRDDNGSSSDGSGTQSSWTKHAVEEIPSNPISEEHPDSTCGIVIFSDNNENGKAKEIAICGSKDTMENGKTEKIINPNANGIHDSNILRHSELSAFTRYKTKITASCPPPDNRSNTVKQEFKRDVHSDNNIVPPGNVVREELRIHHIHHHHHVHHYHNIDTTEQPLSNHDAPHCGSSNVMGGGGGPVEGNLEHYSLNRSGSGSKHGSNVNFEVTKVENDVDKSGNTINHDISAKRKAALTKFRQKKRT